MIRWVSPSLSFPPFTCTELEKSSNDLRRLSEVLSSSLSPPSLFLWALLCRVSSHWSDLVWIRTNLYHRLAGMGPDSGFGNLEHSTTEVIIFLVTWSWWVAEVDIFQSCLWRANMSIAFVALLRSFRYLVALIHLHNQLYIINKSVIRSTIPGCNWSRLTFMNSFSPFIFIIYYHGELDQLYLISFSGNKIT